MTWKVKFQELFLDLPSLLYHHNKADNDAPSCLIRLFGVCIYLFIYWFGTFVWIFAELGGGGGGVGSSLVPACQHALIWMFLFYFVCLFVCVCILCSVVYQDGFYGADIYVSIIYWYIILHVTPPSPWFLPCCFPCCFAHANLSPTTPPALHTHTHTQIAAYHTLLKRRESEKK